MKKFKWALLSLTVTFSGILSAMVDYSSFSKRGPERAPAVKSKKELGRGIVRRPRPRHSRIRGDFSLGMENVQGGARQNFWIVESSLQTPWDFFVTGRYRHGEIGDGKRGNAKFLLGFNWLSFGRVGSQVSVDIFGGIAPGVSHSNFGTSRTDKFLGLKTRKEFYRLALEMGFQHHLTGEPESGEIAVG